MTPRSNLNIDFSQNIDSNFTAEFDATAPEDLDKTDFDEIDLDDELQAGYDYDPNYDEPLSDEPPLESYEHLAQIVLLLTCLEWWWQDRQDFFAAGNLSIYFLPEQLEKNTFVGPDFFVALNTIRRSRGSWLVEREGKFPDVIVEILSRSTAKKDRTEKKELYQNTFKTPEYFWFFPLRKRQEFKGFRLQNGVYQEILPNERGWLWSEQLQLYLGIADRNLRYFTPDGILVPNFKEATAQQSAAIAAIECRLNQEQQRANQEQQRADQEQQRADQEQQQKERLMEYLRSQGIDPETLL